MRLDGAAPRRKVQAGSAAARRRSLSLFCSLFFNYYLFFPFQKGKKNRPERKRRARQPVTVPDFGGEIRISLGKRNIEIRRKKKQNHEIIRAGALSPVW